jgi:hypothetical protein
LTGTEDMTTGQKTDDQQIPVIQTMSVVVQAILEIFNVQIVQKISNGNSFEVLL